jgi:hypothetical protein
MELFKKALDNGQVRSEDDVILHVAVYKRQVEYFSKKSQADRLVNYGSKAHLFIDQHGVEYARVVLPSIPDTTDAAPYNFRPSDKGKKGSKVVHNKENGVSTVSKTRLLLMPLRGSQFKNWLAGLMYDTEGKVPNSNALRSAVNVLSNKARKNENRHILHNRTAPDPAGNGFWIDMCDKNWRAIHVTEEGWEIVDEPPILFRRFTHQKPLPVPFKVTEKEEAKTALKLLQFMNLKKEEDKIMFMCSVISYFVPEIEHPCLCTAGPHGSAKSMFFELTKEIVDPSITGTMSMSNDENGLAQQLYHNYFVCYDNLSSLNNWKSDMLCRAVTGAGFSKRKLFTDDEDIIYQFYRCVGLNGINVSARKGDLLDRIILFMLEQIPDEKRKQKSKLLAEFEEERAKILGAMLAVLSKAIKLEKEIKLDSFKRLADFHKWGCAIAQALGYTAEKFNEAYTAKVELQNEEALSASLIATALLEYLKANLDKAEYDSEDESPIFTFEMTPTEWFKEVTVFANYKGIKTSKGYWPSDASHFVRKINEVKPNLEKTGILINRHSDGSNRSIIIDVTKLMNKPKGDDFWDKVIGGST